jgi:hypothetical protein
MEKFKERLDKIVLILILIKISLFFICKGFVLVNIEKLMEKLSESKS